jgi:hypothetical protein
MAGEAQDQQSWLPAVSVLASGASKEDSRMVKTEKKTVKEEHATPSNDEPLSRTDRFFITSMLADEYLSPMSLSTNRAGAAQYRNRRTETQ